MEKVGGAREGGLIGTRGNKKDKGVEG